ncbi:hypothetical protein, partial [Inquilinus limosus]
MRPCRLAVAIVPPYAARGIEDGATGTMRIVAVLAVVALGGLAAGCVPSRDKIDLPDSVPVDRALSADIRYVFFLPGKAGLAPDGTAAIAAAVVEDARRRAKGPAPRLVVTGHA